MKNLKKILAQELNIGHFTLVLALISGFTIGLFILSLIFGWLCCMEPAAGPRMFSNWTLFGLLTSDILILSLILFGLNRYAEKQQKFEYQKTYLIIGLFLIIVYLLVTPIMLISNS